MSDGRLSRGRLAGVLAAVFLLGAVTGGATWHVISARTQIDMFDAAQAGSRRGVFIWSLERKLDLDAQQKAKIEKILIDDDRATDAVKPPVDPRVAALKDQMRADVRATLTPAQAAKYDGLMAELDKVRGRGKPSAASSATP